MAYGMMLVHGITTNVYHVWRGMRQRCENPNNPKYPTYGGRGITVCPAWHDFLTFRADLGERPSLDHSIDRIDNDGNYEPGNCRWATRTQQVRNRKSSPFVDHDGEVMHLADAADAAGITYQKAIHKLYRGVPFDTPSLKLRRLNAVEAGEIKWLASKGHSAMSIADAYGASEAMVNNIRSGKQWADAEPVPTDRHIPAAVSPRAAKYVIALSDWKAPYELVAAVGEVPRGYLTRLHRAGLLRYSGANNTYRATDEALQSAFRVVVCDE